MMAMSDYSATLIKEIILAKFLEAMVKYPQARGLALVVLWMMLGVPSGYGIENIQLLTLSKDKIVVKIDSQKRVLKIGQTSPEGVTLTHIDSQGAELEIDGQRQIYTLENRIGTHYQVTKNTEAHVFRNELGMYRSVGTINGLPVNFLVDTGATVVAMNAREAKRLGIDFRVDGQPTEANTASGVVPAHSVKLKSVKIGEIELFNVDGMVIEGEHPLEVLLGNSFLGKLQLERQNNQMILRKTY